MSVSVEHKEAPFQSQTQHNDKLGKNLPPELEEQRQHLINSKSKNTTTLNKN